MSRLGALWIFHLYCKKKIISFRFQTDDWTIPNTVLLKDTVVMSGFPHSLNADELKEKLPERFQKAIENVSYFPSVCLSICPLLKDT